MNDNLRRETSNAYDSAPGVGDGRRTIGPASPPKSRKVMLWVLVALVLIAVVVMIAKPEGASRENAASVTSPAANAPSNVAADTGQTGAGGGPAGQTPSYGQPGGAGSMEVYAPGKVPAASEDAPGRR